MLGWIALGIYLVDTLPGLTTLIALVPLLMGVTACLAYMFIDRERYEVERGYKSIHNPLKGQELAHHLLRVTGIGSGCRCWRSRPWPPSAASRCSTRDCMPRSDKPGST